MQSYPARYASFNPPQRSKSSSKSLPRWPHPDSYLANPTSLATAGFYFNPSSATPDAVSCFICNKGLADWDPDDDPAQIHVAKCPKCPWAILYCIKDTDADGNINFASSSRLPTSRAMEKARLATFGPESKRWWPHDVKNKGPTSKAMAKTGFIYTPMDTKDDTCTCIYCDIQLGGWQPDDDPMEEHRSRQAKNGPCPFFTHASDAPPAPALTKQRTRAKSKPPTTPAPSASDDDEYLPPGTKSSTRAPAPSTSSKKASGSAKSAKSKSVKKSTKAKTIEDEVVTEYHVVIGENEDASPKPRPKSHRSRASSRSRSRASSRSRSRASSAKNTTADESESVVSSTKSSQSKRLHKFSSTEHDPLPPSASSSKNSASRSSSSKKRVENDETERSTRSRSRLSLSEGGHPRAMSKSKGAAKGKGKGKAEMHHIEVDGLERTPEMDVHSKPVLPPRPAVQLNGFHHAPQPPPPLPHAQFKSFQSPEDEEFAREEEALEEQARELMLADPTLILVTTPLQGRAPEQYQKVMPDASSGTLNAVPPPPIEKGKGKAEMLRTENAMDINTLAPSTPPPPQRGAATVKPVLSSTVKFPHLVPDDTLMTLPDAERAMTVEQWVRHEMDRQYEQLRSDGRQKIDAFKARAEEVARQIESL